MKHWAAMMLALVLLAALAGCGDSGSSTPGPTEATGVSSTAEPTAQASAPDDAAAAVEAYITAKVAGDRDALAQLICSSLESRLDAEALSFNAVEATIEDMQCASQPGGATVLCTGQISATYGAENRAFPLGEYAVTQEDGVWKWCGEASS